jgi:hypothetical protein
MTHRIMITGIMTFSITTQLNDTQTLFYCKSSYTVLLNAVALHFIILHVNLLDFFLLKVILLHVILLHVILLKVILLKVILLKVILLFAILVNVALPGKLFHLFILDKFHCHPDSPLSFEGDRQGQPFKTFLTVIYSNYCHNLHEFCPNLYKNKSNLCRNLELFVVQEPFVIIFVINLRRYWHKCIKDGWCHHAGNTTFSMTTLNIMTLSITINKT